MFKKTIIASLLGALSLSAFASHYVSGYSKSDGTYVQGHMSDDPGESKDGMWKDNTYYAKTDKQPEDDSYSF